MPVQFSLFLFISFAAYELWNSRTLATVGLSGLLLSSLSNPVYTIKLAQRAAIC